MKRIALLVMGFVVLFHIPRAGGQEDKNNPPGKSGVPPITRPGPSPLLAEPTDKELRDAELTDLYKSAKAVLKEKDEALLRIHKAIDEAKSDAEEARLRRQRLEAAIQDVEAAREVDRILFPLYLSRMKDKGLDKGPFAKLYEKVIVTFRKGEPGQAIQLLRMLVELQGFTSALEDPGLKARLAALGKANEVAASRQTVTAAIEKALTAQEHMGLQAAQKAVAVSHDAYYALVGLAAAKPVAAFKHNGPVGRVAFTPDGARLVSSAEADGVKVWDVHKGEELLTIKDAGHLLAVRPDGKRLITFSAKPAGGSKYSFTLKRWDPETGAGGNAFTNEEGFGPISPDCKVIASSYYMPKQFSPAPRLLNAETGAELVKMKTSGTALTFSPDGKHLVGHNERALKIWDATSGEQLLNVPDMFPKGTAQHVVISPDGKRLACFDLSDEVKVCDTRGNELMRLTGHGDYWVFSVAFSPDGKKIATAGKEKVKIWDATNGQCLLVLHGNTDVIYSLHFSSDSKRIASAGGIKDQTVRVWELLE